MAVLNKKWGSATKVTPVSADAVVTGESEVAKEGTSEIALMAKPMMIYVTDGTDLGDYDKIEKIVLMDDKVCVGMWAFNCVKMTPDDVAADSLLADEVKEERGFIFVSRDFKDITAVEGKKMSAKNVFKAMEKFARKAYKNNFKKSIKETIKVLGEFDKINNERKVLADKETRLSEKGDKSGLKKLAKDQEELEVRAKEANELKAELLKFELKVLKA